MLERMENFYAPAWQVWTMIDEVSSLLVVHFDFAVGWWTPSAWVRRSCAFLRCLFLYVPYHNSSFQHLHEIVGAHSYSELCECYRCHCFHWCYSRQYSMTSYHQFAMHWRREKAHIGQNKFFESRESLVRNAGATSAILDTRISVRVLAFCPTMSVDLEPTAFSSWFWIFVL